MEQIYPSPRPESISDDCISKVQTHASIVCQSCNHSSDRLEECNHITLSFDNTRSLHTINSLLADYMCKEHSPDYRCENCSVYSNCTKETTITYFRYNHYTVECFQIYQRVKLFSEDFSNNKH